MQEMITLRSSTPIQDWLIKPRARGSHLNNVLHQEVLTLHVFFLFFCFFHIPLANRKQQNGTEKVLFYAIIWVSASGRGFSRSEFALAHLPGTSMEGGR